MIAYLMKKFLGIGNDHAPSLEILSDGTIKSAQDRALTPRVVGSVRRGRGVTTIERNDGSIAHFHGDKVVAVQINTDDGQRFTSVEKGWTHEPGFGD